MCLVLVLSAESFNWTTVVQKSLVVVEAVEIQKTELRGSKISDKIDRKLKSMISIPQ